MKKGAEERIDEGVLRWFGNVERMENDRIAKRVYVGECTGIRSIGRTWNRWSVVFEASKENGAGCVCGYGFVRRNAWSVS